MEKKRDSKGRFVKQEPEKFDWEALGLVFVILALIFFGGYVLPNWYHDFQKENYDKGFAAARAGEQAVFNDGFQKGVMIQTMIDKEGYTENLFWSSLYCNDTLCRLYDERYNERYSFGLLRMNSSIG